MDCLGHTVILGLLSSEAFVRSVASISQACLLLKALNALLSLLWNEQEHILIRNAITSCLRKKGNLNNRTQDLPFHHSHLHVVRS